MKSSYYVLHFGIQLFYVSLSVTISQLSCPLPNVPRDGDYFPKRDKFLSGDMLNYTCKKYFTLIGSDTNTCKLNGEWSNPTPVCDLKAQIRETKFRNDSSRIYRQTSEFTDGDKSSCLQIRSGNSIVIQLKYVKCVYALRLFLKTGYINFEINVGPDLCDTYKGRGTNQWALIECKNSPGVFDVSILDKSTAIEQRASTENVTLCEIEVYGTETCPLPNYPLNGDYYPNDGRFEPGHMLSYTCKEDFVLIGNDSITCKANGDWTSRVSHCDRKSKIKSISMMNLRGDERPELELTDGNTSKSVTKH